MRENILEEEPIEYWSILKRRRYFFGIPAIVLAFASIILAISLPPTYRAEATILIEDPEIPKDIVGATISGYVSQEIQLISQRLLTASNIKTVVDKFDIYGPPDPEDPIPATSLAERFRADMELDLVSTEVIDSRGRSAEAAIAFTLAFNSKDPETAQNVTEELVSLFLTENQRSSASRTSGVSQLLRSAVEEANDDLLESESELADFKARHEGALPELHELNLDVINRTEQQLSDTNLRIQQLEQRKLQLSAQLSPLSPSAPVTLPTGETIMSDRERLRALLVDYRRKAAIYSEDHPDIVRLEREIATLQKAVGDAGSHALLQEQLQQERERLAELRGRYSDDHPDIRSSQAAIAELATQLERTSPGVSAPVEGADNPAYVFISTQLQSTDLELQNLRQKRSELQQKIARHEALIAQAPQVERHYEALLRKHESASNKFEDLQSKLRAAEVAAEVEEEITGRRFTLIEPPTLPLSSAGPNRVSITLLGFVLSAGVGLGGVVLAEATDDSIRSARRLTDVAGSAPLAVIPYLNNSLDNAQARTQRNYFVSAMLAGCVFCVVYVLFVTQGQ